jgi:hypothetical protein
MRLTVAILFTLTSFFSLLERGKILHPEEPLMEWDVLDYYGYTPMFFIHQDPQKKVWNSPRLRHIVYYFEDEKPHKMAMGLAILYSPAFLVAHAVAKPLGYEADGVSRPYQIAVHLSVFPYLLLGWWALFGWLSALGFSRWSIVASLLFLFLGTNLYYYTVDEPSLSHAFSFSLVSLLLWLSLHWWKTAKPRFIIASALLMTLIVLVRPVNALLVVLILMNGFLVHNPPMLGNHLLKNKWHVVLGILIGLLGVFPQFLYWKLGFDSWFMYSYGDEGFFWNNPQIFNGLFSYRKGWLLYTPIVIFFLIGFIFLKQKWITTISFAFIALFVYVTFSWWCWWYGGSYSQRTMIDIYPWLALGGAALFNEIQSRKWLITPLVFLMVICTNYNFLNIHQYRKKIITYDSMTKCSFIENFWKMDYQEQDWWHLVLHPDYEKSKKGIYDYPPKEGWDAFCYSRK